VRNNKIYLISGLLGIAVLTTGLYPATVTADVLVIPEATTSTDRPELPQNGLTRTQVRQQHGEPLTEHSAIGEPPISRWDYEEFSVFFEYDLVITAVLKPLAPGATEQ